MAWEIIGKAGGAPANLADYGEACRGSSWREARAELDGLPGGGLNIAPEAAYGRLRTLKAALDFLGARPPS